MYINNVFVVVNDKRVQLKPLMRIPGSNYINASFIDVSTKLRINSRIY